MYPDNDIYSPQDHAIHTGARKLASQTAKRDAHRVAETNMNKTKTEPSPHASALTTGRHAAEEEAEAASLPLHHHRRAGTDRYAA